MIIHCSCEDKECQHSLTINPHDIKCSSKDGAEFFMYVSPNALVDIIRGAREALLELTKEEAE